MYVRMGRSDDEFSVHALLKSRIMSVGNACLFQWTTWTLNRPPQGKDREIAPTLLFFLIVRQRHQQYAPTRLKQAIASLHVSFTVFGSDRD